MEDLSNEELELSQLPPPGADWKTIESFILTFDAYEVWGSFEKCIEVVDSGSHTTLTELRTCLFMEQRRWHHLGGFPDQAAMQYIHELMEKVRTKVAENERA